MASNFQGIGGTLHTTPASEELKREIHRIASFKNGWNGQTSSVNLACSGFFSVDNCKAECRFCARVLQFENGVGIQHWNVCGMLRGDERENVPIRVRTDIDKNGEAAMHYIMERSTEIQIRNQLDQNNCGIPFLPLGMLEAFLERGYEEAAIKQEVTNFFVKNGLFPDARQLFELLGSIGSAQRTLI